MIHVLIDTCVWIDIAIDPRLASLLDVMDRGVQRGLLAILVPDIVLTELDRNSEAVQERTRKAMQAMVRDALDASKVLSSGEEQAELQRMLANVQSRLPTHQGLLNTRIGRIRTMLAGPRVRAQATTDAMVLAAFRRGLEKKAPFARGRNSCGDSLIVEHFDTYARLLPEGDTLYLITSNKADFSAADDHRVPHPDLAALFDGSARRYSINVAECLGSLDTAAATPIAVQAAQEAADRSMAVCPGGGDHDFDPDGGANLRSRYGGLTWHIFCKKCGTRFDTGESYD